MMHESLFCRSALGDGCSASDCCCLASIEESEEFPYGITGALTFLHKISHSVLKCNSGKTIRTRSIPQVRTLCLVESLSSG